MTTSTSTRMRSRSRLAMPSSPFRPSLDPRHRLRSRAARRPGRAVPLGDRRSGVEDACCLRRALLAHRRVQRADVRTRVSGRGHPRRHAGDRKPGRHRVVHIRPDGRAGRRARPGGATARRARRAHGSVGPAGRDPVGVHRDRVVEGGVEREAVPWPTSRRGCSRATGRSSANRSAGCTGPGRRPQPHHTARWTGPCARGSEPRPRSSIARKPLSSLLVEQGEEALRRAEAIGVDHQLAYLGPVDIRAIEPQPDPTSRTEVGRDEEPLGVAGHEHGLLAGCGLARRREPAVPVVVVGEVGERLVAHDVRDVATIVAAWPLLRLWQRRAGLGQSCLALACARHGHPCSVLAQLPGGVYFTACCVAASISSGGRRTVVVTAAPPPAVTVSAKAAAAALSGRSATANTSVPPNTK